MSDAIVQKRTHAFRRAMRTRARLHGTGACPRLTIKRSLKHVYAQLIDDDAGRTLASASDKEVEAKGTPVEVAKEVGKILGNKAVVLGIAKAVCDRGPYRYHGAVAAIADGVREAGVTL